MFKCLLIICLFQLCTVFVKSNTFQVHTKSDTDKDWWQHATFYQIYPRSFADSDGDGVGDLAGITANLKYLKDIGIDAIWLSPIFQSALVDIGYDVSNFLEIHAEYGTMDDFDNMISKLKELGIKLLMDFVPNHSSDKHQWFIDSVKQDLKYDSFYTWRDPIFVDGERKPPNNWISVFGGPAWTFNDDRQQYYLHQFYAGQPDLNFRNPDVIEEMNNIIKFWLGKGADGFRLDAINHLFEDPNLTDEPLSNWSTNPDTYDYLDHIYTKDLMECYDIVYGWRALTDNWQRDNGGDTRILMTEAYANTSFTMMYYGSPDGTRLGAHMPFNFALINSVNGGSNAVDFKLTVEYWNGHMPPGHTANWVTGSHDHSRVGSENRYGPERVNVVNTILLTLPDTSITYYGEEIGMADNNGFTINDFRDPNRTPMQWNNNTGAGFTTSTAVPWLPIHPNHVTLNVQAQQQSSTLSTLQYYKQLTALRKEKIMIDGDTHIKAINTNVLAFIRELPGYDTHAVVVNLRNNEETIDLTEFKNLPSDLNVVIAAPGSTHKINDLVSTKSLKLSGYDAIVLKSSANILSLSFGAILILLVRYFI